jgi:hypothetical protein
MEFEPFVAWERERPIWARAGTRLDDLAQFHYREAGMAYGRGDKARFIGNLAKAFLANPLFVGRRLWDQRLSPSARSNNRRS